MGKMSELLKEYKTCSANSPREAEVIAELYKIVDWMKENGHLTKPFKLPKKGGWKNWYGVSLKFDPKGREDGDYCGHCEKKLPELRRDVNICIHCGWGIGVVYTVSNPKDLNTRIRRV